MSPPDSASGADAPGCDVCVIGAGPAGAATALRLARLGHDVCLVERAAFPRNRIGESLPPSILPLLDTLGLRDRVEAAGFLRPGAAMVHWAGTAARRDYGPDGAGFQVDRGAFDALIAQAAGEAGARRLQPVRAGRPVRRPDGGWHVPLQGRAGLGARVVVEATGRRAGAAVRSERDAPGTAALYAYWRVAPGLGAESRVESGREAWMWGAPLPGDRLNAAVFVERAQCAGLSPDGRRALYLETLAQSDLLAPLLTGATAGPVAVCDAGSHATACPAENGLLRVGEASVAIDPLSSQGVQSALASAVQASIAVNTLLRAPLLGGLAYRFYTERQAEAAALHARLAAGHYARQAAHCPTPFWERRAQGGEVDPPVVAGLRTRTLAAQMPLTLSARARFDDVPVVDGDLIAPGRALCHPGLDQPLVYLGGVAIAALLDGLAPQISARTLHDDWAARIGPARAADVLTWLWTRRILEPVPG